MENQTATIGELLGYISADLTYVQKYYNQGEIETALKMAESILGSAEGLIAFLQAKRESN